MKKNLTKFKFKGKKFLIDGETSSVFNVTDFDVATMDLGKSDPRRGWEKEFREISPQLQLCLSMACNLSCGYCVFRKRELVNKAKMMDMETAMNAIDMFFQNLPKDQRFARIDFGVTGEPFIAEKYHKILKKHIGKLCNKYKKTIWVGANMSNGLIFSPEKMIKRLGSPMDISIDGVKNDHDKFRKYKNKKGTYSDLLKLIHLAREKKVDIGACSVITADTLDIVKNFKHIFDLGIRSSVYMKPVNSDHKENFSLNKKNLPKFKEAYDKFIDFLLNSPDDELVQYLKTINPEDFFFRFFYRILNRTIMRYRCNCGKSGLYVDWNGKLYPCAHFVGADGQDIGNIGDGIRKKSRDLFLDQTVENRKPCNNCWAKYLCGGGCYYQGWLANKTIKKPDGVKCQLIKHSIKIQSYFISELMQKRRNVLEKLGNPYFSGAINSVPPQKRGAFSPREIGIIGKEDVCADIGANKVCFSFAKNKLRVEIQGDNFEEVNMLIDKDVKRKYQWDEICFYKDTAKYETYALESGQDLFVRENELKSGFIEVPFKVNDFKKITYPIKGKNILEFSVPNKKKEIGFNITISNKHGSHSLVPENFGILRLNKKIKKSKINPAISQSIIFGTKNNSCLPLWIENSSSNLFDEKGSYISYDSSVC